jgi:hypothetical protein
VRKKWFYIHNNRLRFLKRLLKGFGSIRTPREVTDFKTHTNEGELISLDLKIYITLVTVPLKIGWRVRSTASSTCPSAL